MTSPGRRVLAAVEWVQHNPVIPLDVVKALLAVGVVLGWWAAPAQPITDLGSAAAAIAFAGLTWFTHKTTTGQAQGITETALQLAAQLRQATNGQPVGPPVTPPAP